MLSRKLESQYGNVRDPYDAINKNADFIGRYGANLKIYYNLLLDDKAGLKEAYYALNRLCYYVKHGIIVKLEENV